MKKRTPKQKKPVFLYFVITVLTIALIALGALTLLSMAKLNELQLRLTQLHQTVQELSASAELLTEQANTLALEESAPQDNNTPEPPPSSEAESQEEGMLSPSQGTTFTDNTDSNMDNLLSQIQQYLPQNNGIWSVYVCDLVKDSEGVINEHPMQAASLIKLFIMGAVYEKYETLSAQYGSETLDSYLRPMITVSDNDAANTLVSYLGNGDSAAGMAAVNSFCQAHGYTSTSMGRLLLQSNEYGDNYTSATDCGRFLREIYQINAGTAVNATLSHADAMFSLLQQQERRNKIPAAMPDGVQVANKTGELGNVENDAGIIYNTANDLIICFMSENLSATGDAQNVIAQNARSIYGYYNETA